MQGRLSHISNSLSRIAFSLSLVCTCLQSRLCAQAPEDTAKSIVQVPDVVIKSYRPDEKKVGKTVTCIDSAKLALLPFTNAGEALSLYSPVFVKNYGPSGISTLSFRGTGPEHTRISWNGLPLNSPSMSLVDLTLLPVELFDEIVLTHGGSSSFQGSSATGGSLDLASGSFDSRYRCRVKVGVNAGSFEDYRSYAGLNYSAGRFSTSTGLFFQRAQNHFPFRDRSLPDAPLTRRENALSESRGFMHSVKWHYSGAGSLKASVWLQTAHRELPAAIGVPVSEAFQNDSIARASIGWNQTLWTWKQRGMLLSNDLNVTLGWSGEGLYYEDPRWSLVSHTRMSNAWSEACVSLTPDSAMVVKAGATLQRLSAVAGEYSGNAEEWRSSVYTSFWLSRMNGRLEFTASFRQDFVRATIAPPSPGAGIYYSLLRKKFAGFKANAGRVFNLPTLNMLYWNPGGNPGLEPESGWSGGAGIWVKLEKKGWSFRPEISAFSVNLNNWIQWLPSNTGVWSPVNVKRVWSRGIETGVHASRKINRWMFSLSGNYAFTIATNVEVQDSSLLSALDCQLLYVPRHNANATLVLQYQKWAMAATGQACGLRFTSSDNVYSLPAYALMHLSFIREFKIKKAQLAVSARVNNLFNVEYQSVQGMPMPGRAILFGLKFQFLQPHTLHP